MNRRKTCSETYSKSSGDWCKSKWTNRFLEKLEPPVWHFRRNENGIYSFNPAPRERFVRILCITIMVLSTYFISFSVFYHYYYYTTKKLGSEWMEYLAREKSWVSRIFLFYKYFYFILFTSSRSSELREKCMQVKATRKTPKNI